MLEYPKILSDKNICPKFDKRKSVCKWILPSDFNENFGQASLGILQKILKEHTLNYCLIDMSNVIWADPVPLLCLALLLAGSGLPKEMINIELGEIEDIGDRDHRVYLKFFAKQGFLNVFSQHANLTYKVHKKEPLSIDDDISSLFLHLSNIPLTSYLLNADCIHAKIISLSNYRNDLPALQSKVDQLLSEMKDRTYGLTLVDDLYDREALYQKVRKILFELLLNVAEHAYPENQHCFAGVYARIRSARPKRFREAKAWVEVFNKKTVSIYGQTSFRPNHYAQWLEVYICDTGIGITDQIEKWKVPDNRNEAKVALKKAQKSKNRFESISANIFNSYYSCRERSDEQRTAVTGLVHLGHMLRLDEDHCRMYVYETKYPGGWIGHHHPWGRYCKYSRYDIVRYNIERDPERYGHLIPVTGTVYAFSFQSKKEKVPYDSICARLEESARQKIINALRGQLTFSRNNKKVIWFDRADGNDCPLPDADELIYKEYDVIILRPPSQINKFDIAKWLNLIAGDFSRQANILCSKFFLVGLNSYQLYVIFELLKHVRTNKNTEMDWYLVSDLWDVCCLSTQKEDQRLLPSKEKADIFLQSSNDVLSVNDLALLLREMDSIVFWKPTSMVGMDPFFNKRVIWEDDTNNQPELVLPRYLDLPVALVDSRKYHACLRALNRCLTLYPGYKPIPADDLIKSLVREAAMSIRSIQDYPDIIVGSVGVTGATLENLHIDKKEKMYLFYHAEVESKKEKKPLIALLWRSLVSKEILPKYETGLNLKKWRRITTTPYIAPDGEKSISILRYKQNENGSLNFNKSYYARTPEATYNDFERLDILKIGHWYYGSRHDLLTINMRHAFRFSFQELGPLYQWLQKEFSEFFRGASAKAQFLLYPSHPVTDTLFDRIRRDNGFQEIVPKGGMIPLKYVGHKTVSPLLASYLIKDRIKRILNEHEWRRYQWSVVLFDDGTISGKHLRETTQFLQSIGAKTVYLMVVLDRSGLPVQEEVYESFLKRHKRFWRWDVPGLGSHGKCPLCQALAVAGTYLHQTKSRRIKERLGAWCEIWKLRNVDTEWFHDSIKSTRNIDPPLEITFGVDPKSIINGRPKEKRLKFIASTPAAALLMELTRLTPRADVALKKSTILFNRSFNDGSLEIIATQLFLYMDELTDKEILDRCKRLLEWLWKKEEPTEFTALTGLVFFIIDDRFIHLLWRYTQEFLKNNYIGNLDATIIVSHLCKKHEIITNEKYLLCKQSTKMEVHNYILLDRQVELRKYINVLLSLFISNPYRPDQVNVHKTDFKCALESIVKGDGNDSKRKYVSDSIIRLSNILYKLSNDCFVFNFAVDEKGRLDGFLDANDLFIVEKACSAYEYLYDNEKGLIKKVIESLFFSVNNSMDFSNLIDYDLFNHEEWGLIVEEKINDYKEKQISCDEIKTWVYIKNGENEIIRWNKSVPSIKHSKTILANEIWFYCDHFFKEAIRDIMANVLYASATYREDENKKYIGEIKDPFRNNLSAIEYANMWWTVDDESDYMVFKTANATENRSIEFRQHKSFECVERAGGKIANPIIEKSRDEKYAIAITKLYIPKITLFGDNNEN